MGTFDLSRTLVRFSTGFADLDGKSRCDAFVGATMAAIAATDRQVYVEQGQVGGVELFVRAEAEPLGGAPPCIMYMTMRERIRDEMEWHLEMPAPALMASIGCDESDCDP